MPACSSHPLALAAVPGYRDAASALIGAEIEVDRALLGPPPAGQYYWADLEGMEVENVQGVRLGVVDHLMATGANDVLVVIGERHHLVPFVPDRVVRHVDAVGRRITVDWDEDF